MKNQLLHLVARRLGLGILTLIAISLLITLGVEALSGDVCTAMMGQMASEDKVAACHRALNLDRPMHACVMRDEVLRSPLKNQRIRSKYDKS